MARNILVCTRITSEWLVFPIVIIGVTLFHITVYHRCNYSFEKKYNSRRDFENFDNVSGISSGVYIVPNTVHFIRFGKREMRFMEAVCVLAALKNQRPEKLVIHTDHIEQTGRYWDIVVQHPLAQGVLEVRFLRQPSSIFGHELSTTWWRPFHAGDVARLEVLMAEGGIFLDGDSYIVRNLNHFRRFEMTLGWMPKSGIGNQVIIAHKDARFLVEWYNNYREYNASLWFYNAGDKPSQMIREKPHLIHRMNRLMAEHGNAHWEILYHRQRSHAWTKHYAIHLMTNWVILQSDNWVVKRNGTLTPNYFDDKSILEYDASIRDMALAVYPFSHGSVTDENKLI